MNKDMKLFKSLNDIDNHLLMDDNQDKDVKVFYTRYLKYAVASITLVVVVFGGYKLFKRENDTSTSQGDSNPTSDYQTDVKVIHPGDKEPENNEIFVYQITEEEEEQIRQEAEEYKQKMMEEIEKNRNSPEREEQKKKELEEMRKAEEEARSLKAKAIDVLYLYNGEEKVNQLFYDWNDAVSRLAWTKEEGNPVETMYLYDMYLDTIIEHGEEIDTEIVGLILVQISYTILDQFRSVHPEFDYISDKYNTAKEMYPNLIVDFIVSHQAIESLCMN